MTNAQWGLQLTVAQMKALRDAGLPEGAEYQWKDGFAWFDAEVEENEWGDCASRLPANHPAYTLLKAGWLEKPNVRLWFGGDKAPDDWDRGKVLLSDGREGYGNRWKHINALDIIAYIAKDEEEYMPEIGFDSNEVDVGEIVRSIADTVTIAKMYKAEARSIWGHYIGVGSFLAIMENLGLIKPEPTRAERFWKGKERHSLYRDESARALIDAALEFER